MGKEDKARAAKGVVFRDGKLVEKRRCPFPDCSGHAAPGGAGACDTHNKLIKDVLFILDHTRPQSATASKAPAGSKLILPGTRAYTEALKRV